MKTDAPFEWIRPMQFAANDFLQVLINEFTIDRHISDDGFSMHLEFDPNADAIWHRRGKDEIRDSLIPDYEETWRQHHDRLEQFFFGSDGEAKYEHKCETPYPFRFCSGGALPIITIGDHRSYRLHWRDIHPVGWNITNGGSENLEELLNPLRTIQRELSEELLIFDFDDRSPRRLLLNNDAIGDDAFPSPAWREWHSRFVQRDRAPAAMTNAGLDVGWVHGPDDLFVSYHDPETGKFEERTTDGVFLNINAEDLGIEVDRIVRLELPESAVICDGEMLSGHLLNSPIGLFEVGELNRRLKQGETEFRPARLFFSGETHDGASLDRVIDRFLGEKKREGLLPDIEKEQLRAAGEQRFDLCPVTRNLIRRFSRLAGEGTPDGANDDVDIFLSFASEDEAKVEKIRDELNKKGRQSIFFYPESIRESDYSNSIFSGLQGARNLIVIGSRIDHLKKNWVHYEYRSFFRRIMEGEKGSRSLVTLLTDLPSDARPPDPLPDFQVVYGQGKPLDEVAEEILQYLASD